MKKNRHRSARIAAASLAAILAVSCSSSGSDTTTKTKDYEPGVSDVTDKGDAGSARKLRFTFTEGDVTTAKVSTEVFMDINASGIDREVSTPILIQTLRFEMGATANGKTSYRFEITDVAVEQGDAPTELVETTEESIEGLVGITGTGKIDERGLVTDQETDIPADVSDELRTSIESALDTVAQMSVPLPEEAVGLGAAWTDPKDVKANGIELDQEVQYEMTALSDEGATLSSRTTQRADEQDVVNGDIPEGSNATLLSSDGEGTGTLTLRFDAPIAEFTNTMEIEQVLDLDGERATTKVSTTVKAEIAE